MSFALYPSNLLRKIISPLDYIDSFIFDVKRNILT